MIWLLAHCSEREVTESCHVAGCGFAVKVCDATLPKEKSSPQVLSRLRSVGQSVVLSPFFCRNRVEIESMVQ